MAQELFPDVLPYEVGTPATFGFAGMNGRTPADNAPEAMLSLVTNMAVPSGLKPSVAREQSEQLPLRSTGRESAVGGGHFMPNWNSWTSPPVTEVKPPPPPGDEGP